MSIERTTAAAVQQPLLDLDGAPRPRRPRASKLTPRRFCLGFCALVGLGIIGFLGVMVFLFLKNFWSMLGQTPHVESHWNATAAGVDAGDEHIVRPYFGLKEDDAAVERFDLAATIYARFSKEAADLEAGGYEPDESKWLAGWQGTPKEMLDSERWRGKYIPIFREIILRDVPVYSKPIKTTARVVIPKELLPAMIDSNITNPRLTAYFHMLPSSSFPSLIGDRPVKWHSSVKSPFGVPVWTAGLPSEGGYAPPDDDATVDPLSNFLARSGVRQVLLIPREVPREAPRTAPDNEEAVSASASPSTAPAAVKPHTGYDIVTRSAVTMAWSAPIYNATKFKARLAALKGVSDKCMGNRANQNVFMDNWSNKGHFQNLLELEDDANAGNRTRWRYGPFLATRYNLPGPKDYLKFPRVPNKETDAPLEDLAFDWHITWKTAGSRKLSLEFTAFDPAQGQEVSKNLTEYRAAASHDNAELLNALIGNHFDPDTHPLTRSVVGYLGAALMFPVGLAAIHYTMTRSISTGISPVGIFLNHAVETIFASFLVKGLLDRLIGWAIIGVELWSIVVLFGRLEFDWYGWIPVGVARRRSTHSERASARVDATFSTRAKLLFFLVATLAIQFLPVKAHIITTDAPEADDDFGKISTDSYIIQVLHNLSDAAFDGAWLTAALSQIHLNYGLRTFAGQHSFAAVLYFASRALLALPTLFNGWFGRAQLMEPFTFWDAISLATLGTLAWQALGLPQVPQVEPEEE